jgi:P4 family phage/plasmid primase-like protien
MYGSRKPNNQAYMLKYYYKMDYNDDEWSITEHPVSSFNIEKNIEKLSARYNNHPEFNILDKVKEQFEEAKNSLSQHGNKKNNNLRAKYKLKIAGESTKIPYDQIPDEQTLDAMLEELFEEMGPLNYRIKETHQYTMCLPKAYYGPGSYNKWIRVGWALANTSPKLFLTWLKFTCQEDCRNTLKGGNGKFDWRNVPDLFETWNSFSTENPDQLTHRSIMYWAKSDAREKYNAIRKETIDFFVEQSIITTTEFDLASVLYNMYKDRFVCTSIKNNIWYEYVNNRWFETDSGNSLRCLISRDMFYLYIEKANENVHRMHATSGNPEEHEKEKKRGSKLAEICVYLKTTTKKNNIMREARELFYDSEFYEKLDSNPYLLAFNNCVIDFKNKLSRRGQPDDFVSKCTNIDYVPYNESKHGKISQEIHKFMNEIFPNEDLRKYMWEHLASCLIGTLVNQTFHIYKGGGRNGKSKLVELMAKSMGTYCHASVPINLLTDKRSAIGKATPELAELVGIRYGIMQEPSRGAQINEGFMKQITGGDPVQGRPLYNDPITFTPQCQLVVCTNYDFENTSNDDGTWRRLRYIDFQSKMLEKPYEDPKFPKSEFPFQFPLDKDINKKFETWAPVFMAILVDIGFKTDGNVKDCDVVMANSNKHREQQDVMSEFVRDRIITKAGGRVTKTVVLEEFKLWYNANYGKINMPKGKDICEYMDSRYGDYKNGWHGIVISYEENEDNDENNE